MVPEDAPARLRCIHTAATRAFVRDDVPPVPWASRSDEEVGMTAAQTTAETPVLARVEGRVGHLTLNRPAAINALDASMVAAVTEALAAWEHDRAVTSVLLDGAGDRGLCAGADVRALRRAVLDGEAERALDFLRAEYRLDARIAEYPKPVLALMDGITMGGGVGLSAHASLRVVTERSRVAMPETRIGFVPDVGGSHLLARAPGLTGVHLGVTAGTAGPGDAVYAGLADHFLPADSLPELTARVLADGDPAAAVHALAVTPPDGTLASHRAWIDECYDAPTALEVVRRLAAHPHPDARETAEVIRSLSPTAVEVALATLTRARGTSLRAALQQELRSGTGLAARADFTEGIRAQLVDKDRRPRWDPPTLEQVDPAVVAAVLDTPVPPLFPAPEPPGAA